MIGAALLYPSLEAARHLKAFLLEYGDAWRIGVGNDHIQLAEADVVAGILLDEPQGAAAVAVALAARGDEQAEFGTIVERVEVDEVDSANWGGAGTQGDHQSQLARGVDVARVAAKVGGQQVARIWRLGARHGPQCGVVFPAIEGFDVGRLKGAQGHGVVGNQVHDCCIFGDITISFCAE